MQFIRLKTSDNDLSREKKPDERFKYKMCFFIKGEQTGHRNADCARVIKENRFMMSNVGRENIRCTNPLFQRYDKSQY